MTKIGNAALEKVLTDAEGKLDRYVKGGLNGNRGEDHAEEKRQKCSEGQREEEKRERGDVSGSLKTLTTLVSGKQHPEFEEDHRTRRKRGNS